MNIIAFGIVYLASSLVVAVAAGTPVPSRPNIIVILADDLGLSDLGCYGGEIHTPVLDGLAQNGIRFTQMYNFPRCSPSRASLLTGQYPHRVGFPNLIGKLTTDCVTIPEVLGAAGYETYISGKWHLDIEGPLGRGFREFYGFPRGHSASCWKENGYVRLPEGRAKRSYADGTFYATDAITDHALDFINLARSSHKPYFLYLAYNAPHFPLHAPTQDIALYKETYRVGWDVIREQRYARMKKEGIIDSNWPLTPLSTIPINGPARTTGWAEKQNPQWATLDPDRQEDLARRMAVYAAMVARMDRNIGRVIEDLRKNGELDNTLIMFLSDNGACAEWDPFGFDKSSGPNNILHRGAALDAMGGPNSYMSYGSGWANVCNTPFRLYKHHTHEGGISTPFIVHWPAKMRSRGVIDARVCQITDILPTCLDAAGATYPAILSGNAILPMEGASLKPAFEGGKTPERTLFFEHEGNRAVREGAWKLVALHAKPWELYDMSADRVEMNDLATRHPEVVKSLAAKWETWAKRCMKKKKGKVL